MESIIVNNVSKDFKIYKRASDNHSKTMSLFHREYEIKQAVNDISFVVEKGDIVGYIGPNGAGKSTTIKMLVGILNPTSGKIIVNGKDPYVNRKENAMNIGVVFGQRSQLFWDLPMLDTFELNKKIYKIDDYTYHNNLQFFIELLDMKDFIRTPVRQLSLGQKMRAEFAVALLHSPDILYLDEPTIGLDVISKRKIRQFVKELNREMGTTVVLTTHDMDDIEQTCNRLIMIDKGEKQYDGNLQDFKSKYIGLETIDFEYIGTLSPINQNQRNFVSINILHPGVGQAIFNNKQISRIEVLQILMDICTVTDIKTNQPKIEDILSEITKK